MGRRYSGYTLYGEIKADILAIQKLVLDADDGYAENAWRDLKHDIHRVAEMCRGLVKERKEIERQELLDRKALQKAERAKVG